jgi:pyridoxamine 5'-phosphate oxidase
MRTKYKEEAGAFMEGDLKGKEPISQFREWFEEACKNPVILEANSVCLATATR